MVDERIERDPFLADPNDARETKKEARGSSGWLPCPNRNRSIGKKCCVCEKVSKIYNTTTEKDPLRNWASNKRAKATYYANAVIEDKGERRLVLMELPKKIGDNLLDHIEEGKWLDIFHPKAGIGREMEIMKAKGDRGFPTYTISPVLEKANWNVDDEFIEKAIDVSDQRALIDYVLSNPDNVFSVSREMKEGETKTVRFIKKPNKKFMNVIWKHWGVTQGQIDGKEPIDIEMTDDDKEIIKKEKEIERARESAERESTPPQQDNGTVENSRVSEKPMCFGKDKFFDPDDDECKDCEFFKACAKAVATDGES